MPPKIPGVWGLAPKEHESHYFTLHEGIQNDFLNQLLTRIKTVAHPSLSPSKLGARAIRLSWRDGFSPDEALLQ
jgi:hypothetical protein